MTTPTIDCPRCDTLGHEPQPHAVPCDSVGNIIIDVSDLIFVEGSPRTVETCWSCNGFTVVKKSHGAYKTQAAADKGLAAKTGRRCTYCRETGHLLRVSVLRKCFSCSGVGQVPTYVPGGILGEQWSHCDTMAAAVSQSFADTVTIQVTTKPSLTWGEAHLGVDSLITMVDYGRRWDQARKQLLDGATEAEVCDSIRDEIRDHLRTDRTQWIKILDRETRVMASVLVVFLTPNGLTVKAANVAQSRPLLPPTYTDAVMNAPM